MERDKKREFHNLSESRGKQRTMGSITCASGLFLLASKKVTKNGAVRINKQTNDVEILHF